MRFALRPTSHPEMTIYFWRRRREVEGDNRHGQIVNWRKSAENLRQLKRVSRETGFSVTSCPSAPGPEEFTENAILQGAASTSRCKELFGQKGSTDGTFTLRKPILELVISQTVAVTFRLSRLSGCQTSEDWYGARDRHGGICPLAKNLISHSPLRVRGEGQTYLSGIDAPYLSSVVVYKQELLPALPKRDKGTRRGRVALHPERFASGETWGRSPSLLTVFAYRGYPIRLGFKSHSIGLWLAMHLNRFNGGPDSNRRD
jgi:hypothetical protein